MKKKFVDPNIENKSKTVEEKIQLFKFNGKMLPLPTEIEISESGTCNRTCSFCPRSAKDFVDKKEFISNFLHQKLCIIQCTYNIWSFLFRLSTNPFP